VLKFINENTTHLSPKISTMKAQKRAVEATGVSHTSVQQTKEQETLYDSGECGICDIR
jgi:hypothetical protein